MPFPTNQCRSWDTRKMAAESDAARLAKDAPSFHWVRVLPRECRCLSINVCVHSQIAATRCSDSTTQCRTNHASPPNYFSCRTIDGWSTQLVGAWCSTPAARQCRRTEGMPCCPHSLGMFCNPRNATASHVFPDALCCHIIAEPAVSRCNFGDPCCPSAAHMGGMK